MIIDFENITLENEETKTKQKKLMRKCNGFRLNTEHPYAMNIILREF